MTDTRWRHRPSIDRYSINTSVDISTSISTNVSAEAPIRYMNLLDLNIRFPMIDRLIMPWPGVLQLIYFEFCDLPKTTDKNNRCQPLKKKTLPKKQEKNKKFVIERLMFNTKSNVLLYRFFIQTKYLIVNVNNMCGVNYYDLCGN